MAALDLRRLNTHEVSKAPGGSREGRDAKVAVSRLQTSFL